MRDAESRFAALRLLVSLDPLITKAIAEGRNWLTSEEIVTGLKANPDAEWREYRGKSPITERQIAWLLRQYDVYPGSIHPQGRANRCVRGYRLGYVQGRRGRVHKR